MSKLYRYFFPFFFMIMLSIFIIFITGARKRHNTNSEFAQIGVSHIPLSIFKPTPSCITNPIFNIFCTTTITNRFFQMVSKIVSKFQTAFGWDWVKTQWFLRMSQRFIQWSVLCTPPQLSTQLFPNFGDPLPQLDFFTLETKLFLFLGAIWFCCGQD